MSGYYTANVDGSFHTKSGVGGWGFLVKDVDGQIIHSDSGAVPNEFNKEYEQYAFAQMLAYVVSQNIDNIHVKTDLKIMARRFSEMTLPEIFEFAQKFNLNIHYKEIKFSIEHISRKLNKEADTLSKSYIYELFSQEKKEILENCYPYGHKDLNFLQLPKMKYAIRSTSHDVVNRVYHALKRNHLFVDINLQEQSYELYRYVDGSKNLLKSQSFNSKSNAVEDFFNQVYDFVKDFGRVVLVTENEDLYHQLIGYTEGEFSPSKSNEYVNLIENVDEIYVYHDKPKQKNSTKRSRSLKFEIQNMSAQEAIALLKQNNSKRIRQMMISVYIYEFQETYGRSPNSDEIQEIIKSIDEQQKQAA